MNACIPFHYDSPLNINKKMPSIPKSRIVITLFFLINKRIERNFFVCVFTWVLNIGTATIALIYFDRTRCDAKKKHTHTNQSER